jgi:phage terminase large subunit-like protein
MAEPLDPVTRYATAVVAGETVAGYLVKQACQRHLRDLEQQVAKGLVWKPDLAQRAIDFFAEVLFLPENTDADEAITASFSADPRPFVLEPWQAFIVGSAFGWYTTQGFRRFREVYLETAKGSGKTPLGAGMMLYLLIADGEKGAQVFLAAVSREQAGYAWRDCRAMVQASPELVALFGPDGFRANELIMPGDGGFLRPVSSEKRGLDGKRVHGALADELHEHATPIVVNKMRAGTKGRRNALIVKTTNSGFDRTSVCWNHHEYSRKVLDGTLTNETWFAFVAGLDPCEACRTAGRWFPSDDCATCDSWQTEGPHWLKPNPNLGKSLPWSYLRERVGQAKGMPSEVSDVLRFNFCVWTQGTSRAIDMGRWALCAGMPSDRELVGAPCYGGLDLGESDDFSAWVRIWLLPDGRAVAKWRFWIPEVALERFPNRPYDEWKRRGLLNVTEGDVTDYAVVREQILTDCSAAGVVSIAYDTRSATETAQVLQARGIDMVPIHQGFALHEAIKRTLELIVDGDLCHGNDPIMTWMASNVVLLSNQKNEKRIAKEKAPDKIDGFAALVTVVDWAIVRKPGDPMADDPEVIFV